LIRQMLVRQMAFRRTAFCRTAFRRNSIGMVICRNVVLRKARFLERCFTESPVP
jgi:hypothetical protein